MIPVFEPNFTEEDIAAVSNVLRSGWLNEHDKTREFEQTFAEYMDRKYAVVTTSGTIALFLALKAAGVTEKSRVIVPDITAIGTVRAIQLTGAWAIIVDVDEQGNIDANLAKKANASHVVAVHNNGYPCDIGSLVTHFGKKHVIEDACQGIGSYRGDSPLGSLTHLGCHSLATTKIITAGQGGVVTTDDENLYSYMQRLKNQGNFRGVDMPDTYHGLGYNFKWTEMNAALALSQMKRLPQRVKRMREIVEMYHKYADLSLPPLGVLPWRIIAKVTSNRRNEVIAKMRDKGIGVQPLPKPIHHHVQIGEFPNADKYASERIHLPSSFTLKDKEIEFICKTFKEITQ